MKSPIAFLSTPFRVHAKKDDPSTSGDEPRTDADLAAVFGLAWLACALTTIWMVTRGDTSGDGSALPALVVLLIPYLLRDWGHKPARRLTPGA
ncbi:hypothetical protein [Sorangium sp. So ce381]|uniref:hypothetical protein n=1 Tax=unclassified Sorangium TaxID=2621164 RepID=UPI003F5B5916